MTEIEPMLRLPEVKLATGVSKRTIYRWVGTGLFPRPIPLGPGAVGWRQSDIARWREERLEARQAP